MKSFVGELKAQGLKPIHVLRNFYRRMTKKYQDRTRMNELKATLQEYVEQHEGSLDGNQSWIKAIL